jgi:hypothetical protein
MGMGCALDGCADSWGKLSAVVHRLVRQCCTILISGCLSTERVNGGF